MILSANAIFVNEISSNKKFWLGHPILSRQSEIYTQDTYDFSSNNTIDIMKMNFGRKSAAEFVNSWPSRKDVTAQSL